MRFGIVQTVRPDGVGVEVVGELDMDTAPELRVRLVDAVRAHDLVVLDLAGVTFIDSQGLSVLIRVDAEAKARGAELRIERASYRVRQILALTDLTGLFRLPAEPDEPPAPRRPAPGPKQSSWGRRRATR
jgi:anti-anti-sigma factor